MENLTNNVLECNGEDEISDIQKPSDDEETKHFMRVVNAFKYYKYHSVKRILAAERYFVELPVHHRQMVPNFRENLQIMRTCVDHNYEIIKLILDGTGMLFENKHVYLEDTSSLQYASEFDMDKVKSTLKQFVRDWSEDGHLERKACYQPVLDEILMLYPQDTCTASDVKILVPGAGLGRLAFEIARLGYYCQGNEFSLFMLFSSNFVLNKCKEINCITLYPWVHQFCNNFSVADQLRPITIPDINPSELPHQANFSMAAGDFLDVYTCPDTWDCVTTVFFIDTAHNIFAYIESIYRILKPGGHWINFGPLLYHFADMPNEASVEISYEDLMKVVVKFNFEIVKEQRNMPATYTQNPRSMLKYQYDCIYFVARKPYTNFDNMQPTNNKRPRPAESV